MAFLRPVLLSGLYVVLLAAASASGEVYIHPAGAWKMEVPGGWIAEPLLDQKGLPLTVLTPDRDAPDDELGIARGIWVYAVPVPTDESLETTDVGVLAAKVLTSGQPGLRTTPAGKAKLGILEAAALDITGKQSKVGEWRGRMLVAIIERGFIVVSYGAPPAEFDALAPACEQALKTMQAPLPPAPRDEPPVPQQTQRARDAGERMTPCVPMIHILARVQGDKGDTGKTDTIGTASGFIVTEDGHIVTNRHVVAAYEGGKLLRLPFDPLELSFDVTVRKDRVMADVVAVSYRDDLALLKIRSKPGEKWPFVPLVDSSKARRGDRVVVMGWPDPQKISETDISQNEGSIMGVNRDMAGRVTSIRHSARTTAGNSGGPLWDLELGGVVAAHNAGLIVESHGFKDQLGHRAVPSDRIVWEFPQIVGRGAAAKSTAESRALIAYYMLQERFGPGVIEAKRVLAAGPDPFVAGYLGRMYVLLGEDDRGLKLINESLNNPASKALASMLGARTVLDSDDYKQAIDLAQQAAKLSPNDPEPHLVMGEALLNMGQWDQARRELDEALRLSSDLHPEALCVAGSLDLLKWLAENQVVQLPTQKRMPADVAKRAQERLERSLALWPARNSFSHAHLAAIKLLQGDAAAAQKHRELARKVAGSDPDQILASAWLELILGQWELGLDLAGEAYNTRSNARAAILVGWGMVQKSQALAKDRQNTAAAQVAQKAGRLYAQAARQAPDAHWAPTARQIAQALGAK